MIAHLTDRQSPTIQEIKHTFSIDRREWTFSSGKLARLSPGSATISDNQGNLLLTTVGIGNAREGIDFFPLSVDFVEKYYASGKIGGNRFQRREGRPSEQAILTSRLIDRPIRPLFQDGTKSEVQIISTILSAASAGDFGFAGITGASLAILLSKAQWFEGPVAGVRIAINPTDGSFLFDPSFEELARSPLDLTLAGTLDAIMMVESEAKEVSSEMMMRAFEYGHELIKQICREQLAFVVLFDQSYKVDQIILDRHSIAPDLMEVARDFLEEEGRMNELYNIGKKDFEDVYEGFVDTFILTYREQQILDQAEQSDETIIEEKSDKDLKKALHYSVKQLMRTKVITENKRLDGRRPDEVRPVLTEAWYLPRTHGSALFERGMTQVLSIATLGGPSDAMTIDDMFEEEEKRYIHHYNFPPYATGETKPLRGTGRREVGHGRLAEKALLAVLPSEEEFPYIIRVVSETLTCNGSSSMGSVCGSSLALMDAGVPIKASVAGIAMGMIYDETTLQYTILSDIQAQEDFLGDMDFKVAATKNGITALQMDCKIAGLTTEMVAEVFAQAKESLKVIHAGMDASLSSPRGTLSSLAPLLKCVHVPEDKMRDVIGRGGEMIQGIEKNFGVEVNLEDNGFCTITSRSQENGQKAYEFILSLIKEIEVGEIYHAPIIKILDTVGAIVELTKWKEGMVHISKFGIKERVANVNDIAKVGDILEVRVYGIDKEKGRIQLEKVVKEEEKKEEVNIIL
jgi:polyribonucleotide nucleotidyltransferase